ncbi:radical SAM/SPASM domain-containing protein [Myroides odoratus]|uniref:radical SAM/SPASM domain-containing protein n=1 Tax=Myroides odoratus TaxID=256 RepID=UPI00333EDC7E
MIKMTEYKFSNYIVISDPVINESYQIIYSTRTNKKILLKVDLIKKIQDFINDSEGVINKNILDQLIDHKILVNINENELEEIVNLNNIAIEKDNNLRVVIQPTANCQLGCGYCGQVHSSEKIGMDLIDKIVYRISNKLDNNLNYKSLTIDWFGGEPLLGLNSLKEITTLLKIQTKEKKIHYGSNIVTNGVGLKKNVFFDLSTNYDVKNYEITLDGTEEFHDSKRHTKKFRKTFSIIIKNLIDIIKDERFNEVNSSISVRINVDKHNKQNVFELIDFLAEKEILHSLSRIYIAPIHSWGNDAHLTALTKDEYGKLEIDFFLKLIEKRYNLKALLPTNSTNIVCLALEKNGELIDAFGDVYNCTEISQVEKYNEGINIYKIENLLSEEEYLNKRPLSLWNADISEGKFPCSSCKILPICGGACPKLWYENISPCPIIKYNINDRLILDFYRDYKNGNLMIN